MWTDKSEDPGPNGVQLAAQEQHVSGPTFEDLAIDPELDDVERVVRYSTGTVELQRLVHVLMLGETAQAAGFEVSRARLFPLVDMISKDQEQVIRQNLATQLAVLCEFCNNEIVAAGSGERKSGRGEDAYNALIQVLLPVFKRLVSDSVQPVREEASIALIQVSAYVREEDLMEHVLSIVLELAHDEDNEDSRITAAGLLNGLSSCFGAVLCRQFCIPEIISLGQDPNYKVRRAVAYSMDKLLTVDVDQDRLLGCFDLLCADKIWGVRKACADSLALIAESVPIAERKDRLLKLSDRLAGDPSRWVRGALSQRLGRFIASLPQGEAPEILIRRFADMTRIDQGNACWINKDAEKPSLPNARRTSGMPSTLRETVVVLGQSMDFASNIMFCCAFNFPAVVMASPQRWSDMLLPAFRSLVACDNVSVRRTIAYSLHEIARILGPDITEQVLFPVLDDLLADVEQVKFGVVETFSKLFAALAPHRRGYHIRLLTRLMPGTAAATAAAVVAGAGASENNAGGLPNLADGASAAPNASQPPAAPDAASGNDTFDGENTGSGDMQSGSEDWHHKWRLRHVVAVQLRELCQLFEADVVFDVVVPIGFELFTDDVEIIRDACNAMVGPCLRKLRACEASEKYGAFQELVLRFAFSESYFERQQYINMCAALSKDENYAGEFTRRLLDPMLTLADDAVPNVRIVLATALLAIFEARSVDTGSALLSSELLERMQPALAGLQEDKDRDVALAAGGDEQEWLERRLAS